MEIFLETERLVLRRFTPEDVDLLVELDGDPLVMRYLTGGRPTPREEVEQRVLPGILETYGRSRAGRWAALAGDGGEFLGWFALDPEPDGGVREVELGYRLRAAAWGRGLATEGARALVHAAFTRLGPERVWAQTMAVNTGSRRVMEKAGLRCVRTFHVEWDEPIPGAEHGDVEYELRRADYRG